LRITLDRRLCQGHGTCCEEAPAVLRLDANGELQVLHPEPPDTERERVLLAVKYCPTRALRLEG
jgi:ferredoxin